MAIDNGSQSTKVGIYDTAGNEICYGTKKLKETISPSAGYVIHPDDDLWDSVKGAIKNCLDKFEYDKKDIIGIGLCSIRCCRVLLKGDGTLAYPVISWMDIRLSKPYIHENDEVKFVTSTTGYLSNRLTGEFTDSAANLEVNWPIDVHTLEWLDEEKIQSYGLKKEMLFKIVKPAEKLGDLRPELCKEFGLNDKLPVIATANDKAVEVLGAGVLEEKSIMISLGTYISSMLARKDYFENAVSFFPTLSCIPCNFVYESSGIRRGMWTVSWFKDLLGDDLTQKASAHNMSEEEYLNFKALDVPAGSDGLITILDWLATPDKPYRRGAMIGFDNRHTSYHMYRSILEAIAFNIKNNIDDMLNETGAEIDEIVVIGGGSKSDLIMQIIADLFGKPVIRRVGSSSACVGGVICTCIYLGIYDSFENAVDTIVKTEKVFEPNKELFRLYNDINEKVVKNVRVHTDEILKISYDVYNKYN